MKDLILTFREDVNIYYGNEGKIFLQNDVLTIKIAKPSPGINAFIQRLEKEGATEEELADLVIALDDAGSGSVAFFYYYLERFLKLSIICRTIPYGNAPFATLEPVSYYFKWKDGFDIKNRKFIVSRFAMIRRENDRSVLESPLSLCRIILHHAKSVEILHCLRKESGVEDICEHVGDRDRDVIVSFLEMLFNNDLIVATDDRGKNPEDENEVLRQWEFHDLLFHSRHRTGRNNYPHGATYSFYNKIEPRPPYKPPMTDNGMDLFTPDMEKLRMEDYPLALVMEERKSIRTYADKPITVKQLGEFLYRSYRIKEVKNSVEGDMYEITARPCAGGGACYELELYPVVNKCEGLSSGIYHYDALRHKLHRLTERNETVEILLRKAYVSAAEFCVPEVLIAITARFQRLSWKYRGMAYAAIMKNVGALYQNMYLVATAMELSPCALGSGDSELLCLATGLDYLVESPVGEFMLGSKRI